VVLGVLASVVVGCLGSDASDAGRLGIGLSSGPGGVLEAAGLLFFAFAGYARIATLGEEVRDPRRTIPRAIPLALGIVLAIYAAVAVTVLTVLGPAALAKAHAPLAAAVQVGSLHSLTPLVRAAAAIASLGVLLSLIAGIGRTTFAMADNRELPHVLAAVHPRHRVPHRAELAVGAVVAVLAATIDLRHAIGFSSFAVLVYYAIANASAFTLTKCERRRPRWLTVAGVAGCLAVAFSLPWTSVAIGTGVLGAGALAYAALHLQSGPWRRRKTVRS
jgi:APA family basic amino acid/polyamine antiporter